MTIAVLKNGAILIGAIVCLWLSPRAPAQGAADADPAPGDRSFQGTLLREGAFLTSATGRLDRSPAGEWIFNFLPDDEGRSLAPMALLPCMNLAAMEQIAESRTEAVTFVLSGQVFVYQERNYLLPTSHGVLSLDRATEDSAADDAAPADGNGDDSDDSDADPPLPAGLTGTEGDEPEVERLIESLDEATPERRPLAPAAVGVDGSNGPALKREGTLRTLRRGKIVRDGASLVFVTENGAEDPVDTDPPMILMPCQNLAQIESLLMRAEAPMDFRISGRVFVYANRNYLMPTMYVVDFDRGGNLISGQ